VIFNCVLYFFVFVDMSPLFSTGPQLADIFWGEAKSLQIVDVLFSKGKLQITVSCCCT